jgi:phytoene/squalene synthetase
MSAVDAFAWCEAEVRRVDYDRYLSALFAPALLRRQLFALYAFNHEVAKAAEVVREPMAGIIRLQWWRETVEELYVGKPRRHEAVLALAETLRHHDLPRDLFDALIGAREADFAAEPFADFAALEAYADATSGNIMRLAARILGAGDEFDIHAREAGIAYALTGLLRALPYAAARRHLAFPRDMLAEAGLDSGDIFDGRNSAALNGFIAKIARIARAHLAALRTLPKPGVAFPALLPAQLCPLYLRKLTRGNFNSFRASTEVAGFRRQLALLRASLRGRV